MSTTESATQHLVADRDSWIAARLDHLQEEKEFTRKRDELSRKRRDLPWLEVTEDYSFEGDDGPVKLSELFGDNSQLLVYHFMFGPGWGEGCPSCSFWADNYDGIGAHLDARDTSLVAVSRGPLSELNAYKKRMGWSFPWYSSAESSFNFDMGVSFSPEDVQSGQAIYNFGTQPAHGDEMPGISIFTKETDGNSGTASDTERIFLTYQTFSRGLDMLNGAYHMLDLTPKGRDEEGLGFTMAWLRRHDSY